MTALADLAVRSAILLVVALGAEWLLRRRSAALRHWVLTAGVLATAALLPLVIFGPTWEVARPAASPVPGFDIEALGPFIAPVASAYRDPAANVAPVRAWPLPAIFWAVGLVVALALLVAGFRRLVRLTARARPLTDDGWMRLATEAAARHGVHRSIVILQTTAPSVLATWGWRKPRVLLPAHAATWTDDRVRIVLCHEIAHIARCDWVVQVVAEVLRAIFWFNPLAWILCQRLRRTSELACDDAVLSAGVPARDYAVQLLDIARICRLPDRALVPTMPMARRSTLEGRITAMLNADLNRRVPTRRSRLSVAATVIMLTVAIGALRPSAQIGSLILSGSAYDTSGGVLPQVTLTLEDAQAVRMQATTDSAGRFEFAPAGPGRYVLEASLQGFRELRQEITLKDPRDWHRAITLQVGTLQERISVRERRPAMTRPVPGSEPAAPLRVGGNIRVPRKLKDVRPIYPASMRDAGLEGVVPIDAIIGTDGAVVSVRVVSAQVHPDFAVAAVDAVRQWRFSPTLLNGTAVEVVMTVSVQFSLSN